jgi:hypothetical protein
MDSTSWQIFVDSLQKQFTRLVYFPAMWIIRQQKWELMWMGVGRDRNGHEKASKIPYEELLKEALNKWSHCCSEKHQGSYNQRCKLYNKCRPLVPQP